MKNKGYRISPVEVKMSKYVLIVAEFWMMDCIFVQDADGK